MPLSGNRVESPPVSPTSAASIFRNGAVVAVVEEDVCVVVVVGGAVEEDVVVVVGGAVEEDVVAAVVHEQAETTSTRPTHQAHDLAYLTRITATIHSNLFHRHSPKGENPTFGPPESAAHNRHYVLFLTP